MKKFKERIYLKKWMAIKPYEKQAKTDLYYLKLANDVKKALLSNKEVFQLFMHLDSDEIDLLACFLTSYFEDVISETNIWNSFIKKHKQQYGKPVPFYDVSEYYEDEINIQDVSFLIWYFMNSVQQEQFILPLNDYIIDAGALIISIFDEAWEHAPENESLKSYYQLDEVDYYVARNLIETILFKTYLFYADTAKDLKDVEMEIIEKNGDDENLLSYLNENHDHVLHTAHTSLLGMKGAEWAAEILGTDHPASQYFRKMTPKILGYFFYKGQDDENVHVEHIASGKKFNITKKSFADVPDLSELDRIIHMGIVNWMEEWWFSGILFTTSYSADLIMDEKNSTVSRKAVNFLDHKDNKVEEVLSDQFKAFLDFNGGSQIAFLNSDKVESFLEHYMDFYNKSLKRTAREYGEARSRARKEGFFGNERTNHQLEDKDNALVFFNPKSGVEIALNIAAAFPSKANPFYNEEESEQAMISLIISQDFSPELVMYCLDHYKEKLQFFKLGLGQFYIENIDFIMRFTKRKNYFTKPEITFTGGRK